MLANAYAQVLCELVNNAYNIFLKHVVRMGFISDSWKKKKRIGM